ncbi:MAG: DUF58 domain-containing protein [Erysipelotrichaceae bacterium]|nr:DUF58 domain-containing protein [Erysipelotrichaceae bacterium]
MILLVGLIIAGYLLQQAARTILADALEASLSVPEPLVEVDDICTIRLTLTNTSKLFIPFVRYRLSLPASCQSVDDNKARYISATTWLAPRQICDIELKLQPIKRGRILLQDLTLSTGDFLGLSENYKTIDLYKEIIAYPKRLDSERIEPLYNGLMGELSVRRFIHEDPILTIGFSEYTGNEPMKNISWPQSAKVGRLMVKNFDHTAEPHVVIILHMSSGTVEREIKEKLYSYTRTICHDLETRHINYAMVFNTMEDGILSAPVTIPAGYGTPHYRKVLEHLGRGTYEPNRPLSHILPKLYRQDDQLSSLYIISPDRRDIPYAESFCAQHGIELKHIGGGL